MAYASASITYRDMPGMSKREINNYAKAALQDEVRKWHKNTLPGHFKRSAASKYGYKKRTRKYISHKIRRFGTGIDLIYTGQMRREMVRKVRVSGTAKKAKAVMTAPRHLYYTQPGQPNKQEEILAITQSEASKAAISVDKNIQRRMRRSQTNRTENL